MPQSKKTIITADVLRDTIGVGSVLKVRSGGHEGITKRPTERTRLDEITSADIKKPSQENWTHPFFGNNTENK